MMNEIDRTMFPEYLASRPYLGIDKALQHGCHIHLYSESGLLRVATLSRGGVPLAFMEEPTLSYLLETFNKQLNQLTSFEVHEPYSLFVFTKKRRIDRIAFEQSYDGIERAIILGAQITGFYNEDTFHARIENYSRLLVDSSGLGLRVKREGNGTTFIHALLGAYLATEERV